MYMYIYICIYIYMYLNLNMYLNICICAYIYINMTALKPLVSRITSRQPPQVGPGEKQAGQKQLDEHLRDTLSHLLLRRLCYGLSYGVPNPRMIYWYPMAIICLSYHILSSCLIFRAEFGWYISFSCILLVVSTPLEKIIESMLIGGWSSHTIMEDHCQKKRKTTNQTWDQLFPETMRLQENMVYIYRCPQSLDTPSCPCNLMSSHWDSKYVRQIISRALMKRFSILTCLRIKQNRTCPIITHCPKALILGLLRRSTWEIGLV